jgi:hypothetical protein
MEGFYQDNLFELFNSNLVKRIDVTDACIIELLEYFFRILLVEEIFDQSLQCRGTG